MIATVLGSVFAVHVLAMISPGPNVLIVTQAAVFQSRRAGLVTALGIATGAAVWSGAALLGLTVVFANFPWLHVAIKLAGGAYLLYLGIKIWRTADEPLVGPTDNSAKTNSDWAAFRLGLITNLTNPKAGVFFCSIFAALLTPDSPACVKMVAFMIIIFDAVVWHSAVAYVLSTQHARQVYGDFKRWYARIAGTIMICLGVSILVRIRTAS